MVSKNKTEEPGMAGVLFAGSLTFLIGAVLGIVSLISQPVRIFNEAPNPESLNPGEVYYIRGDRITRAPWRGKEEAWRSGQVNRLILTEAELNQWSETRLKQEETEEEASGWSSNFRVSVTPVNFRIQGEDVQMVTQVSLPSLFPNTTIHYKVVGHFETGVDGFYFVPRESTLGRAPIGSIPVTGELLYKFLRRQFEKSGELDWIAESLAETETLETSDGRMVIQRKERG